MLNTGIFTDKLQIANVIPLFKKDDENLFTNDRPISFLPTISNVIYKHVYQCFVDNKLLVNVHYGFREEHSTE